MSLRISLSLSCSFVFVNLSLMVSACVCGFRFSTQKKCILFDFRLNQSYVVAVFCSRSFSFAFIRLHPFLFGFLLLAFLCCVPVFIIIIIRFCSLLNLWVFLSFSLYFLWFFYFAFVFAFYTRLCIVLHLAVFLNMGFSNNMILALCWKAMLTNPLLCVPICHVSACLYVLLCSIESVLCFRFSPE